MDYMAQQADNQISAGISENDRLQAINDDLVDALQALVDRIDYYTSMGELAQPNIENWAYTHGSTDMEKARAALAKAQA